MSDLIEEAISQIAQDVLDHKVVLFMKGNREMPQCGFSGQVIHILNETGAGYETRDVLTDPNLREAIKRYSDWPTLPQLYIDGEFVGGCDIVTELFQTGELQKLVSQA